MASYPALVDWPTMATLTGLLVLTKGLEVSGAMHWLGRRLIGLMATERAAAVWLVIAAALLSTVLTNDVALFVIVPLTLGICRITPLPTTRLVVFEALAVNAGSALTPIGNPQNRFLWQLSGSSFGGFVLHMLPLVAVMLTLPVVLTRPPSLTLARAERLISPLLLPTVLPALKSSVPLFASRSMVPPVVETSEPVKRMPVAAIMVM